MFSDNDKEKQANEFINNWNSFNYIERGSTSSFWRELLSNVYGINDLTNYIKFEKRVPNMDDHVTFIDAYIPSTRVLIEQKSPNVDLNKKEDRSSFKMFNGDVTPYEQAKTYGDNLPLSQKPRWIITCNFREFQVYDMEKSGTRPKPTIIPLKDLNHYYYQLDFLVDATRQDIKKEEDVSSKACELISEIYHKLLKQYGEDSNDYKVLRDVNKLCVRLVFCFYADDSGVFGKNNMFEKYMEKVPVNLWRNTLKELFAILNQPLDKRDSQLDDDIAKFPYVNGGMFSDQSEEEVKIPKFNSEIVNLIINKASKQFDWSQISPTIFGSMFETTLNPEERHTNGMHYTSVQNIHKVIDPLFLDDLRHELNEIKTKYKTSSAVANHAEKFQKKLSSLDFFDPACGSGNFLTETYLCLRKLENEAIKLILSNEASYKNYFDVTLGLGYNPIKISIKQFYGIEINDFAVSVARTAMWIAESQMIHVTRDIINQQITFLPLTSNPNIIEGNALEVKWEEFIKPYLLNYIISNPPFVSSNPTSHRNDNQKSSFKKVMNKFNGYGKLDFVAAWFKKAADMMSENKDIMTAMVSTKSIMQGQQLPLLWEPLMQNYGLHINFAYKSFPWKSAASDQAGVDCVIIGFSHVKTIKKIYISDNNYEIVNNINPYLRDLPNFFIKQRSNPLSSDTPKMVSGSKVTDNRGKYTKFSSKDVNECIEKYPETKILFRKLITANSFMKSKNVYCLWLKDVPIHVWKKRKFIRDLVENVREARLKSSDKETRKSAEIPYLFQSIRQPDRNYIFIPAVTGDKKYRPLGLGTKDEIITNTCLYVKYDNEVPLWLFGILSSSAHMMWIHLTAGRHRDAGYNYSSSLVYNTFPFPELNKEYRDKISDSAYNILKIRKKYENDTIGDLYSALPPDLMKAHSVNDHLVLKAYGINVNASEDDVISELLRRYNNLLS